MLRRWQRHFTGHGQFPSKRVLVGGLTSSPALGLKHASVTSGSATASSRHYTIIGTRHTTTTLSTHSYVQRRQKSGFFDQFHHRKERTFWAQLSSELRKRPKRVALMASTGVAIVVGGVAYWWYYQDEVPHSGRRRLMDVSQREEQRMGLASFHLIKQQYRDHILPDHHPTVQAVKKIGWRIIEQTDLRNLHWEFVVIQADDNMNAFVLPGGKVCVFTGLLPVTADQEGLATVLGHEIGHVVARHGAEKWSKMRWVRALGWLTAIMIAREEPGWMINTFLTLFLTLPFSRKCEAEADYIGLMLMAEAGFDPEKALELWLRFSKAQPSGFKYLSTHPPHANRIALLQQWMPEARDHYHHSPTTPEPKE